jgi:hypothetical protein
MKTKITILISMLSITFAFCQNQDWEIQIGLSNRAEGASDVIEYYDRGYYIEGLVGVNQEWKGWNIKTSINGGVLWDKILLHNLYFLEGASVAIDNEGNRYVAGVKFNADTRPFVSKFNPCGEEVWCRIILNDQLDEGDYWDIIINENDEIIILGNYLTPSNEMQIYLDCFDKNGEYLWHKQYASKEDHPWIYQPFGYNLMEHYKEYYISGYCYWPFPSDTTHYFLRPLFIGIDSLFNEKWILPFYALDSVFGMAYKSIAINDSLLAGVGIRRIENNKANMLFMLFNNNGEEISFSQIPNDSIGSSVFFNYISEVERVNDSLFLSLLYLGSSPGVALPVADIIFDKNAKIFNLSSKPPNVTGWAHIIKSSDSNFVNAMDWENPNGDYDIYLYKINKDLESVPFDTNTYTYDSLCPEQIQSGTIDLSNCLVWTGTEEIPSPEEYYSFIATIPITAYPNPAETEITLVFENTEHHTNMLLECYNIYGQEVLSEKIYNGQQQTKLSVSNWSKGLYFAVVKSEGKVAGTGKFVRR